MNPRERRAARHRPFDPDAVPTTRRRSRAPRTVEEVVDTALDIVATEGYDALTMRRLATALDTGPASLYNHVVNKADLDELLIGRLCAALVLPDPDPAAWRAQLHGLCTHLRDQYLAYPGISRAAFAAGLTDPAVLRVTEGILAIMAVGGVAPQAAAWATDALLLFVAAYCFEAALREQADDEAPVDREELRRRFAALPAAVFPQISGHAAALTAGEGHERFDFAVTLMIDGLGGRSG